MLQPIANNAFTPSQLALADCIGRLASDRGLNLSLCSTTHGPFGQELPAVGQWFNLQRGVVHEWLGTQESADDSPTHTIRGADTESSAKQRGNTALRKGVWTPPLELMCGFAMQAAASSPRERDRTAWIGTEIWPHGMHAVRFTADRRALLSERSLFVDGQSAQERLWAADLALRSRTCAAVIVDGRGFDLTATRRLQLVAESSGCVVMLARPPWEQHQLSAAALRWLVCWDASQAGKRRWTLQLLRHKGRTRLTGTCRWVVERDHETCAWCVAADLGERSAAADDAAPRLRRLG